MSSTSLEYVGLFLYKVEGKQFVKLIDSLPFSMPTMAFTLNDEKISKDLKSHFLEKIENDQFESHQMKGGTKSEEIVNYVFCFENVYFYMIIGSVQSSNINVSKLEVLYSEMKRELKVYARNNFANLQTL
jgi:hypothetical protein